MRGQAVAGQLAASDTAPQAFDANPAAAAVAIACAVLAGLAVLALARSRKMPRIDPAPASIDLRPETPAIVDFLTGGFEVEDDAVPATVVDLAARNWFSIEEYGEGNTIIRTRNQRPAGDPLQPYEQRVLDHIEHHAINGTLPTQVLTIGPKGVSDRWVKGFDRSVVAHAQQLGLSVDRFGWQHHAAAWILVGLAFLPAILVGDAAETADDTAKWASTGNIMLGLAFVVAAVVAVLTFRTMRVGAQRPTPAGVEAAAHWLGVRDFYRNTGEFTDKSAASVAIWDHHLAYATAMGLAQTVQRQIPFETEHDRHAWSRATGQWRRVKVRYRTLRPGWGRHPAWMVVTGLLTAALWAAVAYGAVSVANFTYRSEIEEYVILTTDQEHWISLGATIAAVIAVAVAARAALRFLLGLIDLFPRRVLEGEVVRRRTRGGGDDSEPTYHLAIDTATATNPDDSTILAYRVRPDIYTQTAQGARVQIVVSPLLGYVKSLTTLMPAPVAPSHVDAPTVADQVIAQALGNSAGAWGAMTAWVTQLAAEHGVDITQLPVDHTAHGAHAGDVAAEVPDDGSRFRIVEPGTGAPT